MLLYLRCARSQHPYLVKQDTGGIAGQNGWVALVPALLACAGSHLSNAHIQVQLMVSSG